MPQTPAQTFKDLLLTAIGHLKQLLQLVEEEHQLLKGAQDSPEELERVTAEKTRLLQNVQKDVDARKAFLEEQQLSADVQGLEAFFASLPEGNAKALRQGWNQLVTLLEKVHQQNNVNGRLINRAMQHFDILLNTLQSTQGKVKVYHPSGGAGDLNIPRNLGKA
ncbi:flagella synthesis protein FlgN [Marinospirillum perlucidum]|uniref:flagella synthesis protein FlgN n=1 Tax=Marinospirillum perlucidum TaxID=1982602 RepID=UPI000DF34A58|nr:flagellar protein FlgN [Marinospirillum perlucidum]